MSGLSRRGFLRGGAGIAAAGASASVLAGCSSDPQAAPTRVEFHGATQAAVLRSPQPQSAILGARVTASNRDQLAELMHTITTRTRMLTTATVADTAGIDSPADDSGTLGPRWATDQLTVTVGVGASLFDDRFGLADRRPRHLTTMTPFADDVLDPAWCHGDVVLLIEAQHRDVVLHAVRDITRRTRGALQIDWRMDGFTPPSRPTGAARNHFGFKDGIANPDPRDPDQMRRLVWAGADDLPWTAGGSYLTVRLIRMLVEFWDRISVTEQQDIFGRDRTTGAPLTGDRETDTPDYDSDPTGGVIPLTSHIRLANPRTAATADSQFLRRSYSYDAGMLPNGNLDIGLAFLAYQQNIARQFETVQKRLDGEPLADYISPFGGGHFFVLPGVRDSADHFGRALLA